MGEALSLITFFGVSLSVLPLEVAALVGECVSATIAAVGLPEAAAVHYQGFISLMPPGSGSFFVHLSLHAAGVPKEGHDPLMDYIGYGKLWPPGVSLRVFYYSA